MQQTDDGPARPRELVKSCILLLVAEQPGHGYDLMIRIRDFGFDWGGPGPIYRELKLLEESGMIMSNWTEGDAGPARRVYSLTPKGGDTLTRWASSLHDLRCTLDDYRDRFLRTSFALRHPGPSPAEPAAEPLPGGPPDEEAPRRPRGFGARLRRR